jgi:hypothetical protein
MKHGWTYRPQGHLSICGKEPPGNHYRPKGATSWRAPGQDIDNKGLNWGHLTWVPDTVKRSRGLGLAWKRDRYRRGRGEATEVHWDYIMCRVPAPVRDRSRTQLLGAPGEIHILDYHLAGLCHQNATWSPLKKPLRPWRTSSGPASGCSISQSAELEVPGCLRILTRICHRRRTAGPSCLSCTTLGPYQEGGRRRLPTG